MENSTSMGTNRTGMQVAGEYGEKAVSFAKANCANAPAEQGDFAAMHRIAIEEAERIGSVPVPATVKGVAKAGMAKLTGSNPEVLVDKLGERLAFERSGTRLYEALILKCRSIQDGAGTTGLGTVDISRLEHFRQEEEAHFHLVGQALVTLGADPTAVTPCADVVGVMSMGLVSTVTDPRTNLAQSLNAILTAELADGAGWELLVDLARELGHEEMAGQFGQALQSEQTHLQTIRQWMRDTVLREAS